MEFDENLALEDVGTITAKLYERHFEKHSYMGERLNKISQLIEKVGQERLKDAMCTIITAWQDMK